MCGQVKQVLSVEISENMRNNLFNVLQTLYYILIFKIYHSIGFQSLLGVSMLCSQLWIETCKCVRWHPSHPSM